MNFSNICKIVLLVFTNTTFAKMRTLAKPTSSPKPSLSNPTALPFRDRATILTPILFKEAGPFNGTAFPLQATEAGIDSSKADLEVHVLEDEPSGKSIFQARINMKDVNQSVLPVDNYGRIKKEALSLRGRPFMNFHLPDGKVRKLDVVCTKDFCESADLRFPFTPGREMKLSMETNIRGLNGKSWSFFINQFSPLAGSAKSSLHALEGIFKGIAYQTHLIPLVNQAETLATWTDFTLDADIKSPFFKVQRRCRFENLEGNAQIVASRGVGAEILQLRPGEMAWLQKGDIVSMQNNGKDAVKLRVFELN